jgi:hypothetical protein
VDRERSLDANTTRNLSEGDRLGDATMFDGDAETFEQLKSLFVAFANSYVNLNGITRPNRWGVSLDVWCGYAFQNCLFRHNLFTSVSLRFAGSIELASSRQAVWLNQAQRRDESSTLEPNDYFGTFF